MFFFLSWGSDEAFLFVKKVWFHQNTFGEQIFEELWRFCYQGKIRVSEVSRQYFYLIFFFFNHEESCWVHFFVCFCKGMFFCTTFVFLWYFLSISSQDFSKIKGFHHKYFCSQNWYKCWSRAGCCFLIKVFHSDCSSVFILKLIKVQR